MLLLKNRIQDYLRFIILYLYMKTLILRIQYTYIHLNIIIPQCVNTRNVKTLFLYTVAAVTTENLSSACPSSLSFTDYIWCIVAVNRGETIPGITVRPHIRIVVPREIRIDGIYT